MLSCPSVHRWLRASKHCHICCHKTLVNSWLIGQGALRPLRQIKESRPHEKRFHLSAVLLPQHWKELAGGVKEPRVTWAMLLSTAAEGFGCRSRNDPGWRRPMTAAGLVTWRQFAVSSGLETTGTSRPSFQHFCEQHVWEAWCQEFRQTTQWRH